jgi:dihydropteroate synthase
VAERIRGKKQVIRSGEVEAELIDIMAQDDGARAMRSIGTTAEGSQVMKKKTVLYNIIIKNVTTTEALIIKQEILARGGDAALPKEAVSHEAENVSLIISGTALQIERLINKIKHQSRGLPQIAAQLDELIKNNNDTVHRYT